MSKPTIVSGIKPTGDLHIGNYLGMLKQAVDLQNSSKFNCLYMIVDYHAMTQAFTREDMKKRTFDLAIDLLSAGLDPKKSIIFVQSTVPEHANLQWIFNNVTTVSQLERMIEYKEKVSEGHVPNVGLFEYPVLMAADILLYKAEVIPVGDDQRQHVELTRDIARTFNSRFGQTFKDPKAALTKVPRVMSLADPMKKMSKSIPNGCVYIHDTPDIIRKKVMSAVTDSFAHISYDPETRPGISNLIMLYSEFSGLSIEAVVEKSNGKKYSEFKGELADLIINALRPIQYRRNELLKNKSKVMKILADGAKRAQKLAAKTMKEIRSKVGLI